MSRAILTFGVGTHEELLEIALPSFRAFADRHGWDMVIGARYHDRPPSWWKVPALREALDEFDEVLFIGADLVIVDGREDLEVPEDAYQALVEHWTVDGRVPGGDLWFVRQPMKRYLEDIWAMTQYTDHGWWEQAALIELMGYDLTKPVAHRIETPLFKATHFLDAGWNVHLWEQQEITRPRIQHATMHPDRAAVMREWAEQAV